MLQGGICKWLYNLLLLVTDEVPLRKFATLLMVPVSANNTGCTLWVKSGEVTQTGLHMGESSWRINPNISQLCQLSPSTRRWSYKRGQKMQMYTKLGFVLQLSEGKKKCRKFDQTLFPRFSFMFLLCFILFLNPSHTGPSHQIAGRELILNAPQHTVF